VEDIVDEKWVCSLALCFSSHFWTAQVIPRQTNLNKFKLDDCGIELNPIPESAFVIAGKLQVI
jgi:hypothetical protein